MRISDWSSDVCSSDLAIGNWRGLVAARQSWHRLEGHLATLRQDLPRLALPRPHKELRVENLAMGPPGRPQLTLAGISFRLMAGEALGIVGASGSGKSTMVRALTGIWPPVQGRVRLDGGALDRLRPEVRGRTTDRKGVVEGRRGVKAGRTD